VVAAKVNVSPGYNTIMISFLSKKCDLASLFTTKVLNSSVPPVYPVASVLTSIVDRFVS